MGPYRLDVVSLAPQTFEPLLGTRGDRAGIQGWDR